MNTEPILNCQKPQRQCHECGHYYPHYYVREYKGIVGCEDCAGSWWMMNGSQKRDWNAELPDELECTYETPDLERQKRSAQCMDSIRKEIASNTPVPEIWQRLRNQGFGGGTIEWARRKLGVISTRKGGKNARWYLPETK